MILWGLYKLKLEAQIEQAKAEGKARGMAKGHQL